MVQIGARKEVREEIERLFNESNLPYEILGEDEQGFCTFQSNIEFGIDAVRFMAAGASFCTKVD